ncbi:MULTISPECIES: AEC family transporter [Microbacterium]|uniref:AEC family transporter n=1 Tax=Microbacterium TaxID=33882 RepID=UPI002780C022|nr:MULTISPECIES: AEC family transporter [Microbacterium]MDQ1077062.1 malonate transporter [Microbacterium sp. SORGH_AS_0969]MDQ1117305.1 malonate transporter [Microbacterium testaceum]
MSGVLTGFAVVGLAVVVGYVIARIDLLGAHARPVLSRLTFFVLSPFLLFTVLATADVGTLFSALLPVSMITAAVIIGIYALISAVILRRRVGETVIGALSAGQVNSNNIGIPISLYMLGNAAYSAPVILFQLLVLMPIALSILDAATSGSRSPWRILRQTAKNPMLIGSALGVLVAVLDIDLPPIVFDPLHLIAGACVPVLLMSYGMSLYGQRVLTEPGRRLDVILASALKLIAMPALAWAVATWFALPADQVFVVVVLAALPTAQNVFNFAQRYGVGEILSRDVVFISTLGCLPVLFAVALLLEHSPA